jgi:hypothetical protein
MFDLGMVKGKEIERERIVKLVNIWDCNNDRCDCDSIDDCVYRQQLIALIKGEQK